MSGGGGSATGIDSFNLLPSRLGGDIDTDDSFRKVNHLVIVFLDKSWSDETYSSAGPFPFAVSGKEITGNEKNPLATRIGYRGKEGNLPRR